jgi:hypothetical protein
MTLPRSHAALAWCIALLVTGTVLWALPLPDNAFGGMEMALLPGRNPGVDRATSPASC